MTEKKPLMQLRRVKKDFPIRRNVRLHALSDISLTLYEGEKFGVVGESGCGKTTLGRVMLQLYSPTEGECIYYGKTLTEVCPQYLKKEFNSLLSIQKKAKKYITDTEKSRRWLHEGSRIAGSLILSRHLPEIQNLFIEAHKSTTAAHRLMYRAAKLEAKAEKREMTGREAPAAWRITAAENRRRAAGLEKEAEELERRAFSFRGKEYDPDITKRALEKSYHDELDNNYETGINLTKLTGREMRELRSEMQMVFQDPSASLDPRQSVGKAIEEVYKIHTPLSSIARREKVITILERVGLSKDHYKYYPNALSGGQKQRVCIARAIATDTRLVILDEALAALDVSVRAQILSLLEELANDGRAYLFITHDLGVAKYFCDRILVMYLGRECEMTSSDELFAEPLHPYTQSLLAAIPRPEVREVDYDAQVLEGEIPNALHPPSGCFFHTRCSHCTEICKKESPELLEVKKGHFVACHLHKRG